MTPVVISVVLLIYSNVFMTFAWYAYLKEFNTKMWIVAALASWGFCISEITFVEENLVSASKMKSNRGVPQTA